MDRVGQILRALLRRALSEHGAGAPPLTGVIVEGARENLEPRLGLQFAGGYVAWAQFAPADCYAFCERHGAWDLGRLRAALMREADTIYRQMREEHAGEFRRQRWRRAEPESLHSAVEGAALLERLRRETDALRRAPTWRRYEPAEFFPDEPEPVRTREPGRRLMQWWAQQREQLASSISFLRAPGDVGSKRAQDRGLRLLKENLAPAQRQQYEKYGYFDVTGGVTGKRYRIRHGRQMNIEQLDKNGRRVCGWCFFPQGSLVAGDVMLAQKLALELYENDALRTANRY